MRGHTKAFLRLALLGMLVAWMGAGYTGQADEGETVPHIIDPEHPEAR